MKPNSSEMARRDVWVGQRLLAGDGAPFSFVYAGQDSAGLLPAWKRQAVETRLDADRTQHVLTWTDAETGLCVRCLAVVYRDYPVAEWTVYLKNAGATRTPILRDIQGLDVVFLREPAGEFVLHGNKGDWCVAEGFEPYRLVLGAGIVKRFAPVGGRPTNGPEGWPYYNLQWPGGGAMLAIGWPGQWAASFQRDMGRGLRVLAGQERTCLALEPGEEIRTSLNVLFFWEGDDPARAQNLWRRWFMAHNIPRIGGEPPPPMAQMQLCLELTDDAEVMYAEAERFARAGIEIDMYWRDAGWYPCAGKWQNTGTWEVDRERFPDGFRRICEWVHARGKRLIVWFEPERIGTEKPSWLSENHPEWILGGSLVNLGDPEAWRWVVERVDAVICENGIDYYRQDFNMDPLSNWRGHDAPDRQGMTENLHVQGYLAFWDELRRRHPGMLIDSCASGGRRNDLETMRRSVPLLRSDFQPARAWEAQQGQTYGLSSWLPYYGSGVYSVDRYGVRSFYMPAFGLGGSHDLAKAKPLFDEWRRIAPLMLGDFHPLTPYSLKLDRWIAWQFDRPEQGDGMVQAFRREACPEPTTVLRLRGLDPEARYKVSNVDAPGSRQVSGKELLEKGLTVEIPDQPGAAIVRYERNGTKQ